MKRDDLEAMIVDLLADHLVSMKGELMDFVIQRIATKALPPFVPPQPWDARGVMHPAGMMVRHRNGLFSARRDTLDEPPSDAWLPLVVGLAGLDVRWSDSDRAFICIAQLSDGATITHKAEIAVPIVRGYWQPETMYYPGDRVFRYGEHHCLKACMAIDPTAADVSEHWEKVGGKYASMPTFKIDDDGTWSQNGRDIGSMKPLIRDLLIELTTKRAA